MPASWQQRLVKLSNENTGGATGLCLDVHDLVLSKYFAGREKDLSYCRAVVRHGCVNKKQLLSLIDEMPIDQDRKDLIRQRASYDLSLRNSPAIPPDSIHQSSALQRYASFDDARIIDDATPQLYASVASIRDAVNRVADRFTQTSELNQDIANVATGQSPKTTELREMKATDRDELIKLYKHVAHVSFEGAKRQQAAAVDTIIQRNDTDLER